MTDWHTKMVREKLEAGNARRAEITKARKLIQRMIETWKGDKRLLAEIFEGQAELLKQEVRAERRNEAVPHEASPPQTPRQPVRAQRNGRR